MKRRPCLAPPTTCSVPVLALGIAGLLAGPLGVRAAASDGQYVRDWLVAGPVSAEATGVAKAIAASPQGIPVPKAGQGFRLPDGQQITWQQYCAPGSIVNLMHALGPQQGVCALGYCTIYADHPGQARFVVGSNDSLAIVLNRRLVYLVDRERPLCPDQDVFTVPLQAGENECLAIVSAGGMSWGFTFRVLTGEEPRPPPLAWDAEDVSKRVCELNSPHWRYYAGDDADFARADYDDTGWRPLSPSGEAVGVKDAPVLWFRCLVWVRPSLVNLPCALKARCHGRMAVYADGICIATPGGDPKYWPDEPAASLMYTPGVPFSFTAAQQVLAVRLERLAETRGQDRQDLRLVLTTESVRPIDYGFMMLWTHRMIIMTAFALFLVFHLALLYYYPRRQVNRHFCLTLGMALATMLVLHAQEPSEQPLNTILYWLFLGLTEACLLCGLALVQVLWGGRIRRSQLVGWGLVAAALYAAAWVRNERTPAQAFAPLMTLEYTRIYFLRAPGKVRGCQVYGLGLACFAAAQLLFVLHEFMQLVPEYLMVPYFWVYGFLAFLASVSVEIGREFAGAVRKLEDLTATLDSRVQQVTQQLQRKLLAQARLETLRYQLNPHFLYNALNSVEALSRVGPNQIPEMVRRLCECLRYALHPKTGGLATLQQEHRQVASYLHVEKVRFGDRLVWETDVGDAVQGAVVPEFLLQPLVENAIKYGMRTSDMPLRVVIRAGNAAGVLEIEVRNTGRWSGVANDPNGGVGLENLKNRLNILFADRYRLTVAEAAGWVSVTVAIPLQREGGEALAGADAN